MGSRRQASARERFTGKNLASGRFLMGTHQPPELFLFLSTTAYQLLTFVTIFGNLTRHQPPILPNLPEVRFLLVKRSPMVFGLQLLSGKVKGGLIRCVPQLKESTNRKRHASHASAASGVQVAPLVEESNQALGLFRNSFIGCFHKM